MSTLETKQIELRDRATFIPCIAIAISGENGYLMRRAGYAHRCIMFGRADGGQFYMSSYDRPTDRTWLTAHGYLEEHWDEIEDEAVIDVEFILGETPWSKVSERYDHAQ